eukprot:5666580-Pleurochrysis_carterae.AAC.1
MILTLPKQLLVSRMLVMYASGVLLSVEAYSLGSPCSLQFGAPCLSLHSAVVHGSVAARSSLQASAAANFPRRHASPEASQSDPRDTTPEAAITGQIMAKRIAERLDEEWIEQEDHARVGGEAARFYEKARAGGEDKITGLLLAIGGGLEGVDMGECFVGAWDVANMASEVLMEENAKARE